MTYPGNVGLLYGYNYHKRWVLSPTPKGDAECTEQAGAVQEDVRVSLVGEGAVTLTAPDGFSYCFGSFRAPDVHKVGIVVEGAHFRLVSKDGTWPDGAAGIDMNIQQSG